MAWPNLFQASVGLLLRKLNCNSGTLLLDDSEHLQTKQTSRIHGAHKVFDKKTGGYFNGQCLMFAVLVTGKFTLPVGFGFDSPDRQLECVKIAL